MSDFTNAYGGAEWGGLAYQHIFKADDPLLNATGGNYATHYGPKVWVQLNFEQNVVGILPKRPYGPENGWRVMSANPTNMVYGVAEDGVIPDTCKPTFVQVFSHPKTMATTFSSSEIEILTAQRNQAITWKDMVNLMGEVHRKGINHFLMRGTGTLAGLMCESVDRVVSANSELTCATDVEGSGIAANDLDIYGIDRDAGASWADATVLANADVVRPLTLALIYQLERTVATRSGIWDEQSQVWLTGYDTFAAISNLLQAQQRFMEAGPFKVEAFSGIKTVAGRDGGFRIMSFNGKPIIVSADVCNKATHLSPIYLLNTRFLEMWVNVPTVYQEIGVMTGNELAYGKLGQEGMYKTIFELICTGFFAQGKLRDLAA